MKPLLGSPQRLVERAGPEMLQMLRGQMMGQNQVRFTSTIDEIITRTADRWRLRNCSCFDNPVARILIFKGSSSICVVHSPLDMMPLWTGCN